MPYEIESYVGAGVLRFGMSPAQVHELLGTPRFARSDPGRLREMYDMSPALTFTGTVQELKLVEIGFAKDAVAGERRAVIRTLCVDDPAPKEVVGTLVFPKLGISLTGFHTGREEGLAVTAFAPGRWDAQLAGSKSFKLP
jgi:hypothetical protein